jgi:hypothetical protein
MIKLCSKCKILQPIDNFYKQKSTKDGYQYQCKSCSINGVKLQTHINLNDIVILSSEEMRLRDQQCKQQHLEQQKQKRKEYYNKTKHIRADSIRKKLKTDPLFKLRHNLKNLIRNSTKSQGYNKNTKTAKILGCSYTEFKQHIEQQFSEGMTWQNYGDWEYDHRTPISWAKDEKSIIKLNHYTNFQPLWKKDNRRKSNRFSG